MGSILPPSSGAAAAPTVVQGGNLGATPSVALTTASTTYIGTLTANCTLTITGLTAGCRVLLDIKQDGTGGRTLSVTVAGGTVSLPVDGTASAPSLFEIVSPDGTNAHVAALGSGPATATVAGTVRLTGDLGGTSSSPTVPGLATKADLVAGVVPVAQLASGTPNGSKFVRDDGTLAVPTDTGFANPMTTPADLIVGGTAGAATRLAKGADGQVATIDPSTHLVVWKDVPVATLLKPTAALFETYDRRFVQSSVTPLSAVMWLSAIYLPKSTVVTSISFLPNSTGSGTHGWAALYDNSGSPALLRQSTDDAAIAWTSGTPKVFTLTSTFTTTYAGVHYIAVMVVSGTPPVWSCDQSSVATANQLAPFLTNSANGGLTTTAPNPAASLAAQAKQVYGYVS